MAAYIIVNIDTAGSPEYDTYKEMAQDTVTQFGGRYIVRGGPMHLLEGEWQPKRLVVLEFPTLERAREWWESEAYAPAKALRQSLAHTEMVLISGYDGPDS